MNQKLKAAVTAALAQGPVSHKDIAETVGVSTASVTVAMRVLRREDKVATAGSRRECSGSGSHKRLWVLAPGVPHDAGAIEVYHKPVTDAGRFWSKVNKDGPTMDHMDTPCWVWTAGTQAFGYGQFYRSDLGRNQNAHRAGYDLFVESVPDDEDVLHHCDNPACVRPEHLYVGNDSDNRMDAIRRGRDNTAHGDDNGSRTRPNRRPKAETHGMSKLTWPVVDAIRAACTAGSTLTAQAKKFNVSVATVHAVVHKQRWVRNG